MTSFQFRIVRHISELLLLFAACGCRARPEHTEAHMVSVRLAVHVISCDETPTAIRCSLHWDGERPLALSAFWLDMPVFWLNVRNLEGQEGSFRRAIYTTAHPHGSIEQEHTVVVAPGEALACVSRLVDGWEFRPPSAYPSQSRAAHPFVCRYQIDDTTSAYLLPTWEPVTVRVLGEGLAVVVPPRKNISAEKSGVSGSGLH